MPLSYSILLRGARQGQQQRLEPICSTLQQQSPARRCCVKKQQDQSPLKGDLEWKEVYLSLLGGTTRPQKIIFFLPITSFAFLVSAEGL